MSSQVRGWLQARCLYLVFGRNEFGIISVLIPSHTTCRTMEPTVDINGFIMSANLISPVESFLDQPKYKIVIEPSCDVLADLEDRVEEFKRTHEDPYSKPTRYQHGDNCFKGSSVYFETFYKPRLCRSLKVLEHDHEFIGKYVNALGNIQVLPDGNAYISVHMIGELNPMC